MDAPPVPTSYVAPQVVQPQLVNLSFMVGIEESPQGNHVALRIFGPTGQAFYLLEHETATMLANQLRDAAAQAKTGLTLPPDLSVLRR